MYYKQKQQPQSPVPKQTKQNKTTTTQVTSYSWAQGFRADRAGFDLRSFGWSAGWGAGWGCSSVPPQGQVPLPGAQLLGWGVGGAPLCRREQAPCSLLALGIWG